MSTRPLPVEAPTTMSTKAHKPRKSAAKTRLDIAPYTRLPEPFAAADKPYFRFPEPVNCVTTHIRDAIPLRVKVESGQRYTLYIMLPVDMDATLTEAFIEVEDLTGGTISGTVIYSPVLNKHRLLLEEYNMNERAQEMFPTFKPQELVALFATDKGFVAEYKAAVEQLAVEQLLE